MFLKGHLTFLRGKIIHILEQDSYRNEGLSVYEISRNGTTTKLNNKVNYKLQPTIKIGCLNEVQGLNQKESRLRGRCIARKLPILEHFFVPFICLAWDFLRVGSRLKGKIVIIFQEFILLYTSAFSPKTAQCKLVSCHQKFNSNQLFTTRDLTPIRNFHGTILHYKLIRERIKKKPTT